MKIKDLLDYQTVGEARTALHADIADLGQRATRAREVGDLNQNQILHTHIDECLELLAALDANEKLEALASSQSAVADTSS